MFCLALPPCQKVPQLTFKVKNVKNHRNLSISKPLYLLKSWLIFDEGAKLYKTSKHGYNWGGRLILDELLNERVAEGVASNINKFNAQQT